MTYRHKQTGWLGIIAAADEATICVNVRGGQWTWTGSVVAFGEQWEAV